VAAHVIEHGGQVPTLGLGRTILEIPCNLCFERPQQSPEFMTIRIVDAALEVVNLLDERLATSGQRLRPRRCPSLFDLVRDHEARRKGYERGQKDSPPRHAA